MKIIPVKKTAIEIKKCTNLFVKIKNREEYDIFIDWHEELKHEWRGGENPRDFDGYSKIYPWYGVFNFFTRSSRIIDDRKEISFDEFLNLVYI